MDKRILSLVILIIGILIITLSLIVWQTGFAVKEDKDFRKGSLKLIGQEIEDSVGNVGSSSITSKTDIIKISSTKSSRGSSSSSEDNGGSNVGEKINAEVFVSPSVSNYVKDNEFLIYIKISTQGEIYAGEFELKFNSNVLEVVNVKEGGFLSKDGVESYEIIKNEQGRVVFASTRLGQTKGISGQGNLAEIKFKSKNTGTSQLTLDNIQLTDTSLVVGKIKVKVKNGRVDVL